MTTLAHWMLKSSEIRNHHFNYIPTPKIDYSRLLEHVTKITYEQRICSLY